MLLAELTEEEARRFLLDGYLDFWTTFAAVVLVLGLVAWLLRRRLGRALARLAEWLGLPEIEA